MIRIFVTKLPLFFFIYTTLNLDTNKFQVSIYFLFPNINNTDEYIDMSIIYTNTVNSCSNVE